MAVTAALLKAGVGAAGIVVGDDAAVVRDEDRQPGTPAVTRR